MARIKRGIITKKRHKRLLRLAKGYYGAKSKHYKVAKETVKHSLNYAYRDRRLRKRDMRSLWIIRINAAARNRGLSYSQFIAGLKKASLPLNRKVLADLAVIDRVAFNKLVEVAKQNLN